MEIKALYQIEEKEITANEIIDRIADTLCGNVGLSEFHKGFPFESVLRAEVDNKKREFVFELHNHVFKMTLEEIDAHYFDEE